MEAINTVRLGVWKQQPAEFFDRAIIDADGTIAPTAGQCKEGMEALTLKLTPLDGVATQG
jgi:hypothetical protein